MGHTREPELFSIDEIGRARINVQDEVLKEAPVTIEKPKAREIIWDSMRVKELEELFRAFLLLPETYTMRGVYFDVARYSWTEVVESEQIPTVSPAEMLPVLIPHYLHTEDGKTHLSRIQLIT